MSSNNEGIIESLKNVEIFELNLSVIVYAKLRVAGIDTVYKLINLTRNDILRIRGIGKVRFEEIKKTTNAFLISRGIDMRFPCEKVSFAQNEMSNVRNEELCIQMEEDKLPDLADSDDFIPELDDEDDIL